MTEPDEIMTRIGHGIELSQRGQRKEARQLFTEVWEHVGPEGDPFHRCALAHSMADVQDDPHRNSSGTSGLSRRPTW